MRRGADSHAAPIQLETDRADWPYADIGFAPEFPVTLDDLARIRSWNALHLLNLANCDVGNSGELGAAVRNALASAPFLSQTLRTSALRAARRLCRRQGRDSFVALPGKPVVTASERRLTQERLTAPSIQPESSSCLV